MTSIRWFSKGQKCNLDSTAGRHTPAQRLVAAGDVALTCAAGTQGACSRAVCACPGMRSLQVVLRWGLRVGHQPKREHFVNFFCLPRLANNKNAHTRLPIPSQTPPRPKLPTPNWFPTRLPSHWFLALPNWGTKPLLLRGPRDAASGMCPAERQKWHFPTSIWLDM